MLKLFVLLVCLSISSGYHIAKLATDVTVQDAELVINQPLHLQGVKKISKGIIENIILRNCSGIIDENTFKHFPKLSKITVWRSNIEEITATLPVTHLTVMGSHFPNLDADLQQKLPKIQAVMFLGPKNFEVDPLILKDFKNLRSLYISEARIIKDCITKDWFKGMESLEELGLSDNAIGCVSEDAFNSLRSLRKLDLTYNHIQNLEKKTLKRLTKLERLGLYENDIDFLDLSTLASQKTHLEELGISWDVLKDSNISAEDLLRAFPKLKFVSFGHNPMPNDFKAGEFCQILRQGGASCEADSVFGVSRILGYSMLGS